MRLDFVPRAVRSAVDRLPRLGSSERSEEAALNTHRYEDADAAVLFVHGFSSHRFAFGRFPELLAEERALARWDLYSVGYNTGFVPDVSGVWAADPDIALLAGYLRTRLELAPLDGYGAVAVVAHSMGGLVLQKALVDQPALAERVSHVFCFGTPSGGLRSAGWGGFLKRQVKDMAADGEFIRALRGRWAELYAASRPFELWVVAGDRDVFVPASSSLEPFARDQQLVVPGNHLEIVALEGPGSMSQQVVVEGLVGSAAPAGPWNSARVAVERRDFQRAVRELMPSAAKLDQRHLVYLALALEGCGRRAEAIDLLREHARVDDTDAKGTLAGRIKRNWLAEGTRVDGDAALELYRDALAAAERAGDHEQAYYHAINVAFLELAYRADRAAAQDAARRALEHCGLAPAGFWRSATEAEARLQLGEIERALAAYADGLMHEPTVHELESAYLQASRIAAELRDGDLREQIARLFRGTT